MALVATGGFAMADQTYDVGGNDAYRLGTTGAIAHITYTGSEQLAIERNGNASRFSVEASYTRHGEEGNETLQARFVQELLPSGSFEDRVDEDPDFLTVLNQPFAVQLDPATLRDLRKLHGAVPFQAMSPLGGDSVLRGFLRAGGNGEVEGKSVVGVRFEADGVMSGPVPHNETALMTGQLHMTGTAYYAAQNALLLSLDETLTIVAQLQSATGKVPVRIVYRRWIRASAKTPQPTPLATGVETESPGVP